MRSAQPPALDSLCGVAGVRIGAQSIQQCAEPIPGRLAIVVGERQELAARMFGAKVSSNGRAGVVLSQQSNGRATPNLCSDDFRRFAAAVIGYLAASVFQNVLWDRNVWMTIVLMAWLAATPGVSGHRS